MTARRRRETFRETHNGSQRQQARIAADRRCGRARKVDRQVDRHRRDGRRDPEGGALALRPGDQHPRRHQPEHRRDEAAAADGSGRDSVEDYGRQIALSSARERNPDAEVGDFIAEQLPPMDFGRIAAQSAKQVIVQKVREAERDRQFDEYKDRIGEIVNGTVKRVEYGNVIVDLGRGEAIIRRDELIPRENFKYGDRVRAYVYDVGANSAARRSSCRARIRSSWPSSSPWKCRRSTTASSRSSRSPAIRAAAPRSRWFRATARSIRSAPASACAVRAFRPSSANCRAKRSTSFRGRHRPPPSSSTRCSRRKSPRSCSTRMPSASRWWCRTTSCRWRSAAAARTCASPRSSPAGTSTS